MSSDITGGATWPTGLTVLHVDKDYEMIAEITEQPVERLRLT